MANNYELLANKLRAIMSSWSVFKLLKTRQWVTEYMFNNLKDIGKNTKCIML